MIKLLDRLWRRHFGRWGIRDPQPLAIEAPYTFQMPLDEELAALRAGDMAKLIFEGDPPGHYEAERMWVRILSRDGADFVGRLDNRPFDMPQLSRGRLILFRDIDIIDTMFAQPERNPIRELKRKSFLERCVVDKCVLEGTHKVQLIFRETPNLTEEGDEFPDSGWRIRGDYRGIDELVLRRRKLAYVALGAVLNRDDSFLHLIDAPAGARFERDFSTNLYDAVV